MSTLKQILIAALLIAAGAVLAHLHVSSQTYYPVAQLDSPDGMVYTAVMNPVRERQACGAANDRFIRPVIEHCKECNVVYARCERELTGLELDLLNGTPVPLHRVLGPGIRLAIAGPQKPAKALCEFLAADLTRRGQRSVACVNPS